MNYLIRHIGWCIGKRLHRLAARLGYEPSVDWDGCKGPFRCTC